jgi:hypothetical protein
MKRGLSGRRRFSAQLVMLLDPLYTRPGLTPCGRGQRRALDDARIMPKPHNDPRPAIGKRLNRNPSAAGACAPTCWSVRSLVLAAGTRPGSRSLNRQPSPLRLTKGTQAIFGRQWGGGPVSGCWPGAGLPPGRSPGPCAVPAGVQERDGGRPACRGRAGNGPAHLSGRACGSASLPAVRGPEASPQVSPAAESHRWGVRKHA